MNYKFKTAIWDHIAENGLRLVTSSHFMSPSQEGQGTSEVVRVQPTLVYIACRFSRPAVEGAPLQGLST